MLGTVLGTLQILALFVLIATRLGRYYSYLRWVSGMSGGNMFLDEGRIPSQNPRIPSQICSISNLALKKQMSQCI